MWIYIKVTRDRFEHIIGLADTISELAKECGTTQNSISSSMSHAKTGREWTPYRRVWIEEEDEEVDTFKGYLPGLQAALFAKGWSDAELAEAAGISRSRVYIARTGKQKLSRDMAQKIAQALGTTVKALEGENEHG
jgi:ribosome-binding protein aMBF1 (putative translation factor)